MGTWPGRRTGYRRHTGEGDFRAETGRLPTGKGGDSRVPIVVFFPGQLSEGKNVM